MKVETNNPIGGLCAFLRDAIDLEYLDRRCHDTARQAIVAAETKLKAIRKENTRLREALSDAIGAHPDALKPVSQKTIDEIAQSFNLGEPSDMVLVDREKLRGIEWHIEPEFRDGTHSACIVCGNWDDKGHEPDCWLAALLKESP